MGDREIEIRPVDPASEAAQWCLARYFAVLSERFEGGFAADDEEAHDASDGRFLLAELDGEPVGCVAVHPYGDWAEVKRMWVAPAARRRGLGARLLAEAERIAADCGARTTRLDTNSALPEAIALYRAAGYREIARYNDNPYAQHWFEKPLR